MGANLILPAGSAAADSTTADPVTRSLRFDTNGKLSRTFGTPNSKRTFTLAFWVKRAGFSSSNYKEIWQYNRGGRGGGMGFAPTQSNWMDEEEFQLSSRNANTGVADVNIALTTRFRDPAAWMHIALVVDTTLGSSEAADRIKIFVNNERQTNYDTSQTHSYYWPAQNYEFSELFGGTGAPQNIGLRDTNNHPLNGYLADIYFIDGAAIEPDTNFIESTGYGSYKPKAFDMSSYSGNSFHIDAQPSNSADLLVSSIDRNDGDTLFADAAKGHTVSRYGNTHHDNTAGNPFGSGTAIYFDGSGDYLNIGTTSDFRTTTNNFTLDFWFKPDGSSLGTVFSNVNDGNVYDGLTVSTSSVSVSVSLRNSSSSNNVVSLNYTNDDTDWHHVEVSRTGSTLYLFVDGNLEDSGSISFTPTNSGLVARVGRIYANSYPSNNNYAGYLFDYRWSNSGGHTASFTAPTAPLELNPVYIGGDQSGNKNHFTPTNISSHDVMLDVPTKNYATLNPLDHSGVDFSEGNLVGNLATVNEAVKSTIAVSSGKWYWEVLSNNSTTEDMIGIAKVGTATSGYFGSHSGSYGYYKSNGYKYNNASASSYGATYASGDIIGVALDLDNGTLTFYKNNSSQGTAFTGLSGEFFAGLSAAGNSGSQVINFGQDPTFAGNKTSGQDTSQSEFYYAPPTGFKSLNTSNLDDPTVTPEENFLPATYTGAGGSEEINLGFTPDLTWIKRREDTGYYHGLYDSARGLSAGALASNTTGTEDSTQRVASFDSDTGSEGFTLSSTHYSYTNTSGKDFISWNWKAHQGGSASYSNTLTLDVRDNYGSGSGWGTTKLEVWEGSTKLTDITNPPSSSSKIYNIKTNDLDKIKIVWYVDSSAGDWYNMYAVLKNSSNTTLASWDGNSWSGNSSDAPSDDDNFYLPSSFDSTNAATTGVVEAADADTEKYNSSAGFTIIKYAGAGSTDGDTKTLDHSLGVPLEFVIAKARTSNDGYDNGDWIVWHKDLASSKYLYLNSSSAQRTESSGYNLISTATSGAQHQVQVRNGTDNSSFNSHYLNSGPDNGTGEDYILYGWAGVEGYSKFGSFVGNGSSDGPMVYTGFRPRWIMVKPIDDSYAWYIHDTARSPYNYSDKELVANTGGAEYSVSGAGAGERLDILSNGFKHRTGNAAMNANNKTMVYACFAESPLKYSNAR